MAFSPGSRQAVAVAAAWVVIAVVTATSIAFFTEIRAAADVVIGRHEPVEIPARATESERVTASRPRTVELKAGAYGHFHVIADVNGNPVRAMVDTGASMVALRFEDAREAGIFVGDADFTHRVSTANGHARMAPVIIDRISIGDIEVRNVSGAVLESGKLSTTLLGMSFLTRLQRVDMRSGKLLLEE